MFTLLLEIFQKMFTLLLEIFQKMFMVLLEIFQKMFTVLLEIFQKMSFLLLEILKVGIFGLVVPLHQVILKYFFQEVLEKILKQRLEKPEHSIGSLKGVQV
jgi:hypothetical protein